jgi:hypothetical protein
MPHSHNRSFILNTLRLRIKNDDAEAAPEDDKAGLLTVVRKLRPIAKVSLYKKGRECGVTPLSLTALMAPRIPCGICPFTPPSFPYSF